MMVMNRRGLIAWAAIIGAFNVYTLAGFNLFREKRSKPNVIVVVLDDLGHTDVSYNGGAIPTPFIDFLSEKGVRFDRHYVHTLCTPSRLALLTGAYSHVNGIGSGGVLIGAAPYSLPSGSATFPKELKKRGYSTHAIGKWHLGSTRFKDTPTGSSWGFDTYVGGLHGGGGHYSKTLTAEGVKDAFYDYGRAWANGTYKLEHDDRHSTHSFTSEAIALFEDHNASGRADPLFLYLAYTAPHTPLQAEPQWLEKCQHIQHSYRRAYCGLVYGADEGIRNVTEAAKRLLGLNTLVMVTSDNGGMLHVGGINAPLRGGKHSGYEGGVRTVGFWTDLMEDPAQRLLPSSVTYQGLMHIADWLPSLLSIIDGGSRGLTAATACESLKSSSSSVPRLGFGHDQWCAVTSLGPSPRTDAVLVLDDVSNFISYIRKPYKLMIGKFGDGEHNEEPNGRYLYKNPTLLQVIEEELKEALDWISGTRDLTFFWFEILHLAINKFSRRGVSTGYNFENVGELVLGSHEGGNVLNNTKVPVEQIPIQVFNVWEDPEERVDLATSHPEIRQSLIASFNEHWKASPPQYDTSMSCAFPTRFAVGPRELCERRTSHLHTSIEQRSVTKDMQCRWEHPFVADEDPEPCGTGNPRPLDILRFFEKIVVKKVTSIIRAVLVSIVLLIGAMAFLARSLWTRTPKRKNDKSDIS